MRYTAFSTPLVTPLFRLLAIFGLKLAGWKIMSRPPEDTPKYVLIAAPHTSNWDFVVMIAIAFQLRMSISWMGKHTLFQFPLGPISRWFGGISVDRRKSANMVGQMAASFAARDSLVLVVPPEGTRDNTRQWKTGFYHIAAEAGVPIVRGYLDFGKKEGGFGPLFHPTGEIEQDMAEIQAFYKDIKGKHPNKFSV